MNIQLTKGQTAMLRPLFAKVRLGSNNGTPGSIMAQVWHDAFTDEAIMDVRFVDEGTARKIQVANNVKDRGIARGIPAKVRVLDK